ncbi:MAG: hydrogenase large subunit, partial [Methanoregulaceae archaeon]
FALAVERISGVTVPERAWFLRTIFLEMERICSHLGDLSGMLVDVAFPLGANQFAVLREEFFRKNRELTGSRFLRGMICIGGVTKDIPDAELQRLTEFTRKIRKQFRIGLRIVLSTTSVIDRFATTGIIRPNLVVPLALSGPAARASGRKADVRIDTPYGIYDRFRPEVPTLHDGDVLSRFTVKAAEIQESLSLIERLVAEMPKGPVQGGAAAGESPVSVRDGHSLALVESPRGQNLCWVCIRDGTLWRYKVRTASFCNWQAIEHAVQGNIIADFPVINKSLNLSYSGTDL